MKKVLAAVLLVLMCACTAIGMTACGESKVDGNTYVYESIDYKGEFSEQEKESLVAMYSKVEFAFKDGKATMFMSGEAADPIAYEQKGNKIVMDGGTGGPQDITVKGDKIVFTVTMEGRTIALTMKKK